MLFIIGIIGSTVSHPVVGFVIPTRIFVLDTLNFCFWSKTDIIFQVKYKGEEHSGYWALCASINRALDEGIPLTSAKYMASITEEQAKHIFRSSTSVPIPQLERRVIHLRESGRVLLEKYGGEFSKCVEKANCSATALLKLVTEDFEHFNDQAVFKGKKGV